MCFVGRWYLLKPLGTIILDSSKVSQLTKSETLWMSDHSNKTSLCLSENIPQNSKNKPLGLYFSKALFEGLILGGAYLRRDIDWASLIVGSKLTVFALFYFAFEGNSPSTSPRGAYIWRGNLMEGFLRYRFGGLIFWRGLYMEGLIFRILWYF